MVIGALLPLQSAAQPSSFSVQTNAPVTTPSTSAVHGSIATFVSEASLRFGIPERWINAVMRVESAGDPSATSRAGAMGLMQVMPETYAMMRARLHLGANPFDPHDNIIAGAAYLSEMHDRYGTAGFLAAYNAGPARWADHLTGGRPLPSQTTGYIVRLGRMLDLDAPRSPDVRRARVIATPEAAPIFVRMSGARTGTGPHIRMSNGSELIASGNHDDSQSLVRVDAIPLQSLALQSGAVPATGRTAINDGTSKRDAEGSPLSQPNNPLFVVRTADHVKP